MIYHIKLINGQEIMGTINDDEPTVVYEPMLIEDRQDMDTGRLYTVLTDFIPFSDENHFVVLPSNIMCKVPLNKGSSHYYKVSKLYNRKLLKEEQMKELQKITDAMEDALTSKKSSVSEIVRISSANSSFH